MDFKKRDLDFLAPSPVTLLLILVFSFIHALDGVNMKETQSPAPVCDRAAAGSDPCIQACHPSEVALRIHFACCIFRSIELRVLCPAREPPIFPVARSMSSLSDAIPYLQSSCRNRGKFTFFNSVRSLLTVPVPKLRLERRLFAPVCPSAPRMCSRYCTTLMTSSRRLRAGSYTLASLQ